MAGLRDLLDDLLLLLAEFPQELFGRFHAGSLLRLSALGGLGLGIGLVLILAVGIFVLSVAVVG